MKTNRNSVCPLRVVQLGNLAVRGERGVIGVPASTMLRQRWNPFYTYIEERILELTGLAAVAD